MAFIDYGAILKVNNSFINKDKDFFMEKSDMNYICEKTFNKFSNDFVKIQYNFFVCAGDKEFLVCFRKGLVVFISNEKILSFVWDSPFKSQTLFFDNLPSVTIEKLDNEGYTEKAEPFEELFSFSNFKEYKKKRIKYARWIYQQNKNKKFNKIDTNRWRATWEYKNNKYEVIFGYGIDNSTEVWEEIRDNHYNYTEKEKRIINEWFNNG